MVKRAVCSRCERPLKTCLCDVIVTMSCPYRVVILQDVKEAKHALSSAPILEKSIAGAIRIVGDHFDPDALVGPTWREDTLLVFPSDDVLTTELVLSKKFKNLILLDGTWRKVARLIHLNPWLSELPCMAIQSEMASQYKIRKSPREDGLSTIEAAVAALNGLSPEQDYSAILPAFYKMIDLQIEAMGPVTYQKNYLS
ncbi:MAG: DTW domain-containing protein [Gammaproteobacteria bacterium]|nr:DTW domain-containing protein [Gammaproteobacteria bacterium]MBU1833173.1 DTW domain-containing protein [Gammaproteobacteria bacterium]